MKLIALGDTHGTSHWKRVVSNTEFDKVVFIGDYFDAWKISGKQQIENFEEILSYKEENMDKVTLLFGNHDYHYLNNVYETYSGYQDKYAKDIRKVVNYAVDNDLVQMCYQHENYIFTHAGITKTWLSSTGFNDDDIVLFLNNLLKIKSPLFKFTVGVNNSPYGDDICQTPIWVRPESLLEDCLEGYTQVVGHTTQQHLVFLEDKIILIDTLDMSGQFLCIDDGKVSTLKILN